ncbi:MAG: CRTAC1 family protein [Blastocatellia bacterium]
MRFIIVFISFCLTLWPQSAPPKIHFEDVTAASGLKLERITTVEKRYLLETMGGGVAFFDYDNDGWLDVYLTNTPTVASFKANQLPSNRLFRNNGDKTFTDVTAKAGVGFRGWSLGVSVADYDNDGDEDLYLTNFSANVLYRNDGNGSFTDVTKAAGVGDARWSASSGWADYDNDGDLDLFVANYVEFDLGNPPEFGKGRYCIYKSLEVLCGPRGMRGAGDALYRNDTKPGGDATFTDVARAAGVADERGSFGLGAAWSDLDDDGDPDLYVANDTQPNLLYWNQGNGAFKEAGLLAGAAVDVNGKARAGMGVAIGDYDNDGRFDLSVTNFSDEAYALFRNQGGGEFSDKAVNANIARTSLPYLGWANFLADFDNDGWRDLFAANGHVYPQVDRLDIGTRYRQRCLLFRNLRDGTFADITAGSGLATPRAHRGAALGDYDRDGDLDLLLSDLDGGPVLLENRTAAGNYLRVRAPIGAKVTVEIGKLKQVDEVRASGGYLSASEPIAHFGLGDAQTVDRLSVRFADRQTKSWTRVKSNQVFTADSKGK